MLLLPAPALACTVVLDSCSCSLAALAACNLVLQVNVSARAQWDRRDDSWIESDVTSSSNGSSSSSRGRLDVVCVAVTNVSGHRWGVVKSDRV